ncbi:helix-turn-helix domain-containing protein [Geoglobus acetivorans]|uniref:Helix-turn-helix domain-containing protein n=1 Tax=Geoglobus acetivorans TaxID=565033 RepID=A0ABZ3H3D0_GEOAI|nr:helix-turn-helix domain-containing protein [Geoglobus acetivorans]
MELIARRFAEIIAGNIVFSENYGESIKKWRALFEVSQKELAERLGITPSVISDYEAGRRKSPGMSFIKKLVESLLDIDRERGWKTVSRYKDLLGVEFDVIQDITEYSGPVPSKRLAEIIDGELITDFGRMAMGHTVVDSLRAILSLSSYDFYKLYGLTSERALIFTGVTTGRSPMVAVRVANLKPSVVVLNPINGENVDRLAVRIAEIEGIDLIASDVERDELVERLKQLEV